MIRPIEPQQLGMNISDPKKNVPLIFIIDDDRFMRLQLRRAMEQEGYQVVEAADGEQGLAAYTCLNPDIVLLDAMMPVMDGFTCCQLMRSLSGGDGASQMFRDPTPILMITALEDQESVDRAFEAGAVDYITKPIHWAVLRQRVRRLLDARRATETLRQQTERERLISRMAQRIRQSLNLEEILNTTAEEVRQFLQADRVLIYRFDSDWNGSVVVESVDEQWISVLGKTILYPYLAKNYVPSYQQNRIQAQADIHTLGLPQPLVDLLAGFQVRAHLVVPILIEARSDQKQVRSEEKNDASLLSPATASYIPETSPVLWGLLIAHQCSGSRQWQNLEIELLKQLATQVAIAIQQSELYQQLAWFNAELERQIQERTYQLQQLLNFEAMLKRITDKVRDSLDECQILQTAVQELVLELQALYGSTSVYNLEALSATIYSEYSRSSFAVESRVILMAECPEIYSQLLQGRSVQFCTIANNFRATSVLEVNRVVVLICPIFDRQGALGDLWLLQHPESAFNELEIGLVQQVANQCAIAMRQARLYQAAQAQVKELEKLNQVRGH